MVNAICCFNTLYMHGYANQNWKMDCCRSVENMHGGAVRVNTYLWDKSSYELILYKLGRQNWTMHHWKTNYEVHIFAETYSRFILAFNIYSQKTKKVSRFAKHTSAWMMINSQGKTNCNMPLIIIFVREEVTFVPKRHQKAYQGRR